MIYEICLEDLKNASDTPRVTLHILCVTMFSALYHTIALIFIIRLYYRSDSDQFRDRSDTDKYCSKLHMHWIV